MAVVFLIASTVAMMCVIMNYKSDYPTYISHPVKAETIIKTTSTCDTHKPEINEVRVIEECGFEYYKAHKSNSMCRYEVTTSNYTDVTERLIKMSNELKTDDRDIQIFLLNHINAEQVLKLIENGEVIWEQMKGE